MFPRKLRPGDDVRIIAPSCTLPSLPWVTDTFLDRAKEFFRSRGMTVSESAHLREVDAFGSTTVEGRVEDLHAAFDDPSVAAMITIRGGFSSNQLLAHLDWDLIRKHPKILCGFSDITALSNAIWAKTGLVSYSGPNFYHFGFGEQMSYTYESFRRCLLEDGPYAIEPSSAWTDDRYSPEREALTFERNDGPWLLQPGEAEGTLLGGNLCTLNLLQGTEFFPDIRESVLFLEDDYESTVVAFDRNLQSLLHLPEAKIRGLVIGRFQKKTAMTRALLEGIIAAKPELRGVPVIANVDFGHTHPMITYPIGGRVKLFCSADRHNIEILSH